MRELMIPLAMIVTPNAQEAAMLSGVAVRDLDGMHTAARKIVAMGARAVLVKGGRLSGDDAVDVFFDGAAAHEFRASRVAIARAHGTGCTLSAAIAAALALEVELKEAVAIAKRYVTRALAAAPQIGHGARPLNHLVKAD